MGEEEFSQLQINCATGDAVEMLLDPSEAAPIRKLRRHAEQNRAELARHEQALARLRARASGDDAWADLLTVLGLEE